MVAFQYTWIESRGDRLKRMSAGIWMLHYYFGFWVDFSMGARSVTRIA